MQATVDLLDLRAAAIEHIDRILFDQTRGQSAFLAARDLLELDTKPCESMLLVEFQENVADSLAALQAKRLGKRTLTLTDSTAMSRVWGLRKAGLSLLTSRKGPAKPTTCIEDVAVRPEQLPDYFLGLSGILKRLDLEACFYGHAASGLLHVRPVIDLHTTDGVRKLRQVTDEVAGLTKQFGGSLAGEHGVGMSRTEYMEGQLGPELMQLMREVKAGFDPDHRFNPGKVIPDGQFALDRDLRQGAGWDIQLPFEPTLAFAARDESFVGNLEQCNGCGGCRKATPTMCPTFTATGEELLSTRGRANLIRTVLESRGSVADPHPLLSPELEAALSHCLACKACTVECPSNVNLTLLKAELLHARHRVAGLSLRERLLSHVDLLGALGTLFPRLSNAALQWGWLRRLMKRLLGLTDRRPLPPYATERFDRWFHRRPAPAAGSRGSVLLWDDTFVRYHEPHIGRAAIRVLEAAGFTVRLPENRLCCGRPAFSQGHLDRVRQLARHNLELLRDSQLPILFLEPSCYAMFAEDYRELKLEHAASVAEALLSIRGIHRRPTGEGTGGTVLPSSERNPGHACPLPRESPDAS